MQLGRDKQFRWQQLGLDDRLRVRLGGRRRVVLAEAEEDLHVEEVLSHLAVEGAEEVEREGELVDELVDHDEVADGHLVCGGVSWGEGARERDARLRTPSAASHIAMVSAPEKMMFWPEFRKARDVVILMDDFS